MNPSKKRESSMSNNLLNMSQQFAGLPMASLIGAPLQAACDSQQALAKATEDFIKTVGFDENDHVRESKFKFIQRIPSTDGKPTEKEISLDVPTLTIVKIPSLAIKTLDVSFEMEVKSAFTSNEKSSKEGSVEAKVGWGVFSSKIIGTISSHKEQTRQSDNSAKYSVKLIARDDGMPEGLARVLDIMQSSISPS